MNASVEGRMVIRVFSIDNTKTDGSGRAYGARP
jgi:hypothetical protein